ncbi:sigma-54-dependent Fis family transcriptional regulator [Tropicibacter alexandrii]|uniref:sigma-54-dependent Fis family transcriptional regulator n=1 Tax=Tropicibacter alexandrii TaxID=2267683 RepID=UPI0013E8F305|nr:sigma-54-dependent Fis family transcriptional regulator [Tropicibacter alexandrii]
MTRASYYKAGKDASILKASIADRAAERDVRMAWETFVTSEQSDELRTGAVRDDILASWQRSKDLGVNAATQSSRMIRDENEISLRRERNAHLRRAASAAFKRLEPHLSDAKSILILADDQGVIIDAIGDAAILDEGQDIHLEIGGQWDEKVVGTNGIGTVLRTGKPMYVHAAEHFVEGVQTWTCAGAPIRNPFDDTVIGVVDLSGPPDIFRRHNVALVLAAAREIEIALAEQQRQERTLLLEAFLQSKYSHGDKSVLLLDRNGRILFRRGVDDTSFPASNLLLVGHKLLPDLEAFSEKDLPNLLPPEVKPQGLERLMLDNAYRGAALFLRSDAPRPLVRKGAVTLQPRRDVPEDTIQIIGTSPKMVEAIELAERAAKVNVSVLIQGETGVGKELFARLIHSRLGQTDAPYVPLNCAAISGDLIGAELFGYVDGAFTGAVRGGRAGKFEQADGGLLCLDEIGDMPIELQPYLLRALEQRAIYRMGDSKRRPVDVRLVGMTNRDLRLEIEKGSFRRDLFYRIGVVTIIVPPLRERRSDILPLIEHFSSHYAQEFGRSRMRFDSEATESLVSYRWPGNVRELRNTVQRVYLVASGPVVTVKDLPPELRSDFDEPEAHSLESILSGNSGDLESIEASAIRRTILAEKGNLTRVAAVLGISRPTLYRKMRQYRIERE